ncbi:hypothetical protein P5V15_002307 [Pogonomyrmex californicus]
MELVVFQYMLIVFAQLLTVDSSTVCRHTRNTRVTKDVETMVTTTVDDGDWRTVTWALVLGQQQPPAPTTKREEAQHTLVALSLATSTITNHQLLPPLPSHLHHIHTPHFGRILNPPLFGSRRRVLHRLVPPARRSRRHRRRPDESRVGNPE